MTKGIITRLRARKLNQLPARGVGADLTTSTMSSKVRFRGVRPSQFPLFSQPHKAVSALACVTTVAERLSRMRQPS